MVYVLTILKIGNGSMFKSGDSFFDLRNFCEVCYLDSIAKKSHKISNGKILLFYPRQRINYSHLLCLDKERVPCSYKHYTRAHKVS